jgi:hypothetical protein
MLLYKRIAVLGALAFAVFIIVRLQHCRGFLSPAPLGTHGAYSLSRDLVYTANKMTKDSVLEIFTADGLDIKFDQPTGSGRCLVNNIPCNGVKIEAYIEFLDKPGTDAKFKVLWFNAESTDDDEEYQKRAEDYYECFEALWQRSGARK